MGYTSAKGIPIPFGYEGNNVPQDYLAMAARLDALLSAHTYTEISALAGSDLWDQRVVWQTNTGALRGWPGLYRYSASLGAWTPLLPLSTAAYIPTVTPLPGGSTTLGTSPKQVGRWTHFGTHALVQFFWRAGTAGFSMTGTNDLGLNLPQAANITTIGGEGSAQIGIVAFLDASANLYRLYDAMADLASPPLVARLSGVDAAFTVGNGYVNPTQPITIANSDAFTGLFFYEVAEN